MSVAKTPLGMTARYLRIAHSEVLNCPSTRLAVPVDYSFCYVPKFVPTQGAPMNIENGPIGRPQPDPEIPQTANLA